MVLPLVLLLNRKRVPVEPFSTSSLTGCFVVSVWTSKIGFGECPLKDWSPHPAQCLLLWWRRGILCYPEWIYVDLSESSGRLKELQSTIEKSAPKDSKTQRSANIARRQRMSAYNYWYSMSWYVDMPWYVQVSSMRCLYIDIEPIVKQHNCGWLGIILTKYASKIKSWKWKVYESITKYQLSVTISNYQPAVCPKVFGPAFTIHPAPVSSTHVFAVSAAHKPRGQGEARLGAGDR